jgi:hypothetical protein
MTLEDLHSAIWSALRKYITEALLPIVHFRRYKAFNNMTRSEFYSLFRATIIGAESVCPCRMLINEQSLTTIMGRKPATDWKQWAMDRTNFSSAKLKTISDYTFPYYVCGKMQVIMILLGWYMDIIKKCLTPLNVNRCQLLKS